MKRIIVAALLGAAVVPATSGAIPPDSTGGPVGSNACAVVGTTALPATCRFTGGNGIGAGGFAGPGGVITLSHKEKTSSCVDGKIVHTVTTKTDEKVTGPFYMGTQRSFTTNVVYTLAITGPGFAMAGGGAPGAPSGAPSEPADTPQDLTGGTVAGADC